MNHSKDTFELVDQDQEPGRFGQLQFIDSRGSNQWDPGQRGDPDPGQRGDPWNEFKGTSPNNDPWSKSRPNQATSDSTGSKQTSTQRAVSFGEINPAFIGDDNKTPVYSTENGQPVITHEHVVRTDQDGLRVVVTSHRQTWRETEKVIKEKDLKILKVFSILSIIFFFPTGIPAFYFARRTHQEFYSGFMRGELDTARKMAKRCEKLIILSAMGALLVVVLTLVIVENKIGLHDGKDMIGRHLK